MREFKFPARYEQFLTATIALALAEVARDMKRRSDEDPRVQAMATVPSMLINATRPGDCSIIVGSIEPLMPINEQAFTLSDLTQSAAEKVA